MHVMQFTTEVTPNAVKRRIEIEKLFPGSPLPDFVNEISMDEGMRSLMPGVSKVYSVLISKAKTTTTPEGSCGVNELQRDKPAAADENLASPPVLDADGQEEAAQCGEAKDTKSTVEERLSEPVEPAAACEKKEIPAAAAAGGRGRAHPEASTGNDAQPLRSCTSGAGYMSDRLQQLSNYIVQDCLIGTAVIGGNASLSRTNLSAQDGSTAGSASPAAPEVNETLKKCLETNNDTSRRQLLKDLHLDENSLAKVLTELNSIEKSAVAESQASPSAKKPRITDGELCEEAADGSMMWKLEKANIENDTEKTRLERTKLEVADRQIQRDYEAKREGVFGTVARWLGF